MFNRYKVVKFLIPFTLILYVMAVGLKTMAGWGRDEPFPIYSWNFFSYKRHRKHIATEFSIIINSIYKKKLSPVNKQRLPDGKFRLRIRMNDYFTDILAAGRVCLAKRNCDQAASQYLYPIVRRYVKQKGRVDFSFTMDIVDLSVVKKDINIRKIVKKRTNFAEDYKTRRELGRWTIEIE